MDRIVFGRDLDGSEEVEGAGGHQMSSEEMRRGKGGGGKDGVWPRHARSNVDQIVFGHDAERPSNNQPAAPQQSSSAAPPGGGAAGFGLHSLPVPSAADLYSLCRLCGDQQGVTAYLARLYDCDSATLAPIVKSWYAIADLPPLVPPSRQRSAPPILPPEQPRPPLPYSPHGGAGSLAPSTPLLPAPASAPVRRTGSSADLLVASLRRVDARLNRQPSTNAHSVSPHNALRVSASMAAHAPMTMHVPSPCRRRARSGR